jgi:cytochrome c oxidase assembly factor CtaG
VSGGAAVTRPHDATWRRALAWIGLAIAALACVPDLVGVASGGEVAQSVWYSLMAMVAPALIVLGAPWSSLNSHGAPTRRPIELLAEELAPRRGLQSSIAWLAVDLAVIVCWRVPVVVDALVRHPVLVLAESATLVVAGIGFWLELVGSAPLVPRSSRPRRAVLAALAMWTVWTLAYLEGMSATGWYHSFRHAAGVGLSASADREASAAVLWVVAAVAFMPVVFWNLSRWLRAESIPADHGGPGESARSSLGPMVSP